MISYLEFCNCRNAFASLDNSFSSSRGKEITKIQLDNILKHNLEERSSFFKTPEDMKRLYNWALDSNNNLQMRWRAIISLGRSFGDESRHYLQQLLNRPEWFLRNAATLATKYMTDVYRVELLHKALWDKALVVRTAAVEVIREKKVIELENELWKSLSSKQNFIKKKSLWIRKNIVETLRGFAKPSQMNSFMSLLNDSDPEVRRQALLTLQEHSAINIHL